MQIKVIKGDNNMARQSSDDWNELNFDQIFAAELEAEAEDSIRQYDPSPTLDEPDWEELQDDIRKLIAKIKSL